MSKANHGKRYSEEFKRQVVDLHHTGIPVLQLVQDYGVSNGTIYKWLKEYQVIESPDGNLMTVKELERLKKENRELRLENEILKKAAVIFAQKG